MDEANLKKILESVEVPAPDENAKKRAVNLAVAEFKSLENNENKSSQGTSLWARLTGKTTHTRRDSMEMTRNRKLIYGGLGTAMAVVLIAGVTVSQFQTYSGSDASTETAAIQTVRFDMASSDLPAPVQPSIGHLSTSAPERNEFYAAKPKERLLAKQEGKKDMRANAQLAAPASPPAEMGWAGAAGNMMVAEESVAIMPYPYPDQDVMNPGYYHDVGRDKFEDFEINSFKAVNAEPVSTFSTDVDTASYSFMRAQINNGVLPQKDAIRTEELINYFDYNYPLPETREQPFKPTVTITPSPWAEGKKLMHIGIKGFDVQGEQPHSNLVFLLDTSGSMNEPNKLPLVINSLKMLLESLRPDDTVAIAVYAGSAGTVLEPTKVSEKQKIVAALENLSAGGSTAGAEGINLAYQLAEQNFQKDAVNRVILATDGDFNVGITNPEELQDFVERKREKGIFLSVLGFGQGNYNDQTMQTLAQNGNGVAAYIDNLNEARKVLVEEATSTLFPIAKDVKIQVEFNPATVAEYRLVGYETRHLNREDFNNDAVDAGDIGAGHAVTAIYEITPVGGTTMVDNLRYGEAKPQPKIDTGLSDPGFNSEYAFVKIRYKLPDENVSKLITTPVASDNPYLLYCPLNAQCKPGNYASNDTVWAIAVASFGQILQGGKYTGGMTYDDVIEMAQAAKGDDQFGYRAEFINLVRLAKTSSDMQPR